MVEKKLLALDSREFYNFKKYSPTKWSHFELHFNDIIALWEI